MPGPVHRGSPQANKHSGVRVYGCFRSGRQLTAEIVQKQIVTGVRDEEAIVRGFDIDVLARPQPLLTHGGPIAHSLDTAVRTQMVGHHGCERESVKMGVRDILPLSGAVLEEGRGAEGVPQEAADVLLGA
jgi:hypothetical protein